MEVFPFAEETSDCAFWRFLQDPNSHQDQPRNTEYVNFIESANCLWKGDNGTISGPGEGSTQKLFDSIQPTNRYFPYEYFGNATLQWFSDKFCHKIEEFWKFLRTFQPIFCCSIHWGFGLSSIEYCYGELFFWITTESMRLLLQQNVTQIEEETKQQVLQVLAEIDLMAAEKDSKVKVSTRNKWAISLPIMSFCIVLLASRFPKVSLRISMLLQMPRLQSSLPRLKPMPSSTYSMWRRLPSPNWCQHWTSLIP